MTTHAPASAPFNTQFSVAATGGGSGNPVTFSSSGACTNVGATFTMTSGTGTCTVKYDQAGERELQRGAAGDRDGDRAEGGSGDQRDDARPGERGVQHELHVAATGGGSGNAVTFSSGGACTNVGATFTMTSGTGTCSVKYDQAGDANYNAAPAGDRVGRPRRRPTRRSTSPPTRRRAPSTTRASAWPRPPPAAPSRSRARAPARTWATPSR